MELVPLDEPQLAAAGELLAARHRVHREGRPELSPALTDPGAAREAVAALLSEERARGLVALSGGRAVGYLVGTARADALRRRHVWVGPAGHALAPGEDPDVLRCLYAALAREWAAEGYFSHFVMAPAQDRTALEAWYSLGFGWEQVHALLPLPAAVNARTPAAIRRAGPGYLDRILEIGDGIARELAASPVFGVYLPERGETWREGYAELLADADARVWAAEESGRVLAFQAFEPMVGSGLGALLPEDCLNLSVAVTRPELRGRGLGRALAAHGLRDAHERGFRLCVSDWRAANLGAGRLLPHLGFRPFLYRLHRRIDDRIAWAQGPAARRPLP